MWQGASRGPKCRLERQLRESAIAPRIMYKQQSSSDALPPRGVAGCRELELSRSCREFEMSRAVASRSWTSRVVASKRSRAGVAGVARGRALRGTERDDIRDVLCAGAAASEVRETSRRNCKFSGVEIPEHLGTPDEGLKLNAEVYLG